MSALSRHRRTVDKLLVKRQGLLERLRAEKAALAEAESNLQASLSAQDVLQRVAQQVQRSAHKRIASVVTRCLEATFPDDPYEFAIDFKRQRGKTEARLGFVRQGHWVNPLTASGGGPVDMASFALRLAKLVLAQPARRRFLSLDEPFRGLSLDRQELVPGLLLTLAKEMDLQIVIATNMPGIETGKIVRL